MYRTPSTTTEWIAKLASSEITISHTISRLCYWYQNALYLPDLLPSIDVAVGIAQNDEIINSKAVHEYARAFKSFRTESNALGGTVAESSAGTVKGDATDAAAVAQKPGAVDVFHWDALTHGQSLMNEEALLDMYEFINKNPVAADR